MLEEKYDEIRQLIIIGKEKGYLLYDEVNDALPADLTSSDELEDLFGVLGAAGIEVVDSEQKYRDDKLLNRRGEEGEEPEVAAVVVDKTNDPVRMYLREMGTVPLLTREGEVVIAKRIERAKLSVIKAISRTPTVSRLIIRLGDQLRQGDRTIRELVVFKDEELTDSRIADRGRQILRQIDAVRAKRTEVDKKEVLEMEREEREFLRHLNNENESHDIKAINRSGGKTSADTSGCTPKERFRSLAEISESSTQSKTQLSLKNDKASNRKDDTTN